MALLLAIIAALFFGLAGWWMKVSQMKNGSIKTLMIGMYIVGTLCFAIHTTMIGSWAELFDYRAILLGIIIGLGSGVGNYLFMIALERGPATLISPLANINIVLVVMLGIIVYDESLSLIQLISITLLISATLLISQKKMSSKKKSKGWLSITLIATVLFAFRNGGLKIAEDLQITSSPILFLAYLLSLILFLFPYFNKSSEGHNKRTGWIFGILTGIGSYAGLQLFAISLNYGQASILAPIFATNSLIVTLGAVMIYKERLNKIQTFAFICLIIGLIGVRITL